jgi:hypothetical protein
MSERRRLSKEERNQVRARYVAALKKCGQKNAALAEALEIIPAARRPHVTPGVTWLRDAGPGPNSPRSARRARGPGRPRKLRASAPLREPVVAGPTIEDAITLLADVITARLADQIGPRIEQLVAQRIGDAAVKLAPAPVQEVTGPDVTLAGIRRLSDGELRVAMAAAKVAGEESRWQKLVNEARRRENTAAAIEAGSKAEC